MKNGKRKSINPKNAAYRVALAGISASLATLFVGLSVAVKFSTIAFYVAASIALIIPVCRRYYSASVFAYAVSAVLGLVFVGFDIVSVAGYVLYFAPMAIISAIMQENGLKWYFALIVKIVFIVGILAALFYGLGTIVIDKSLMSEVPFWLVIVVGLPLLVALDFLMQFVYKTIKPRINKVLRAKGGGNGKADNDEKTENGEISDNDEQIKSESGGDGENNGKDKSDSGNGENADNPFDEFRDSDN